MQIDITKDEQTILIKTIESSDYGGAICRLVADLLDKIRAAKEEEKPKDE